MSLLEIKTVTVTEKGQIAIPQHVRKIEGFKQGSKITLLVFDDHIELRSIAQVREHMLPALASEKCLAKDWNSKEEDEAWKDL